MSFLIMLPFSPTFTRQTSAPVSKVNAQLIRSLKNFTAVLAS